MPEDQANVRPIVWSGVALLVTVIAVVAGVFTWRTVAGFAVSAAQPVAVAPFAPVLQVAPVADRRAYEQQQQYRLESYAWVDREQHIARIPIERAMQLLSERAR